jgi:hypothetical protein
MDLFATLFSIQGVVDTPEAEPAPATPIEAALDGGSSGGCIVA